MILLRLLGFVSILEYQVRKINKVFIIEQTLLENPEIATKNSYYCHFVAI